MPRPHPIPGGRVPAHGPTPIGTALVESTGAPAGTRTVDDINPGASSADRATGGRP